MAKILATYHDGRTFSWEDGEIDGSISLTGRADATAKRYGTGQPMPESSDVDLTTYRDNPSAFLALAQLVHPVDSNPKYEMSGDLALPEAPPDGTE